jgi:tetratricopeptide (TPR) repeat protein
MTRLRALALQFCLITLSLGLTGPTLHASRPSPAMPPNIQRLYAVGHYREAVAALQAAASLNSKEPALQYWLGRCSYELRDYNRAIAAFERAIVLEPNRSEFHEWLGRSYGRKAEAMNVFAAFSALALARKTNHEFATAVRLDPENLEAQRDYIRYLLNAPGIVGGSEQHAQQQIQALAMLDSVEADLARAELLATRKRFDDASRKYQEIMQAKPTSVGTYMEIAEFYRDRQDAAHMDQAAAAAAQVAPDDPRIPYYRGVALVLLKREPARAESYLRNYLANVADNVEVPSHASAHEWLGRLYEGQSKLDQAVAEYQASLALDPRNSSVRDALNQLKK